MTSPAPSPATSWTHRSNRAGSEQRTYGPDAEDGSRRADGKGGVLGPDRPQRGLAGPIGDAPCPPSRRGIHCCFLKRSISLPTLSSPSRRMPNAFAKALTIRKRACSRPPRRVAAALPCRGSERARQGNMLSRRASPVPAAPRIQPFFFALPFDCLFAWALEILAALSLDIPLSRRASYVSGFLIPGPSFPFGIDVTSSGSKVPPGDPLQTPQDGVFQRRFRGSREADP
jgi:hypothetical protein